MVTGSNGGPGALCPKWQSGRAVLSTSALFTCLPLSLTHKANLIKGRSLLLPEWHGIYDLIPNVQAGGDI